MLLRMIVLSLSPIIVDVLMTIVLGFWKLELVITLYLTLFNLNYVPYTGSSRVMLGSGAKILIHHVGFV